MYGEQDEQVNVTNVNADIRIIFLGLNFFIVFSFNVLYLPEEIIERITSCVDFSYHFV